MAKAEPLDNTDPISLDGLEKVFSETAEVETGHGGSPSTAGDNATAIFPEVQGSFEIGSERGVNVHKNLPSDLFTRGLPDDENLPESKERPGINGPVRNRKTGKRNSQRPGFQDFSALAGIRAESSLVDDDDMVSRTDLVHLLEGFVRILRKDGDPERLALKPQTIMDASKYEDVCVEDKTAELEEMRRLVIEAQETIIKLLTDRVEDRARIATLETELRLIPDLQDQADRAMAVAFRTEEFRAELHKVKFELERYRLANVRSHNERGMRGLVSRVRKWFLKSQAIREINVPE